MSPCRDYGIALCLALAAAAVSGPLAKTGPSSSPPVVQGLKFEPTSDGLTIVLETPLPAPRFTCMLSREPNREVSVRLPSAVGHLESRYAPDSPLIKEVRVETMEGSAGLLVRLILGDATLDSVEQSERGILIRVRASAPVAGSAVPSSLSEYRIGSGDKIEINVFGHDDLKKIVEVSGDGTINFPLIGSVSVAGKTVAEIDDEITRVLSKEYLVNPEVSVDVREYKSQWVTIMGQVRTPGRYLLKRNTRLIDLLAEAGGANKDAGSDILITRHRGDSDASEQVRVDLSRLFGPDNQDANIALRHGDIITIGEKKEFYIRGEVTRPGSYPLDNGLTLLKAVSVAGGLSHFANRRQIELLRTGDKGVQDKRIIDLKAVEDGKKEDVPILPNDVIIVPRRVF